MAGNRHAVVVGGGLAGMLTASLLARYTDSVTVVDRDTYPEGPEPRKGVPQARHCHILWSGGARVLEELLPGTQRRLTGAGAHRIPIPAGLVSYTPFGWQHRFADEQYTLACTRPLLDHTVRHQALREPGVTVAERTEALELCGTADRVTGVRVRELDTGTVRRLDADLVVDTSGRGSAARRWLERLGVPAAEEETVDTGMVYATRVFQAPRAAPDSGPFPLVSVLADPGAGGPGRNAVLMPVEGGRWIVTLSGTRGGEPPAAEADFLGYARGAVRHPLVGDLVAALEPLTPVWRSRSTVNRRVHYDRLPRWPEGLLVLGDAATAFNPVYGHGMSAAARGVAAVERELRARGLGPGLARAAQRAVARAADDPWLLATSGDVRYPGARVTSRDPRLTDPATAAAQRRAADAMSAVATRNQEVSRAAVGLMTLSTTIAQIQTPALLAALRRGPERPAHPSPPLTSGERALLASAPA
ncbi:FAD-dependent monooxygenase [Streptomyces sp. TRM70308]